MRSFSLLSKKSLLLALLSIFTGGQSLIAMKPSDSNKDGIPEFNVKWGETGLPNFKMDVLKKNYTDDIKTLRRIQKREIDTIKEGHKTMANIIQGDQKREIKTLKEHKKSITLLQKFHKEEENLLQKINKRTLGTIQDIHEREANTLEENTKNISALEKNRENALKKRDQKKIELGKLLNGAQVLVLGAAAVGVFVHYLYKRRQKIIEKEKKEERSRLIKKNRFKQISKEIFRIYKLIGGGIENVEAFFATTPGSHAEQILDKLKKLQALLENNKNGQSVVVKGG